MALSGTKTFSLNHLEIITSALRVARSIGIDATPDANQKSVATEFLNTLVARWANKGILLWNVEEVDITIVADQITYTDLDATYWGLATYGHYYRNSDGEDREIDPISWREYQRIGNKDETGEINQICLVHSSTGSHTLYVYPVPDSTTGTGTLTITAIRKTDDFTNDADDADFAANWYMALVYGTAVHLARIDGAELDDLADLKANAARYFNEAMHGKVNRESGDIRFIPGYHARGEHYYL